MEIWKDINGYEGVYQVSNLGRVRSLDRFVNSVNGKRKVKGQIMNFTTRSGYNVLILRKYNIKKSKQVHRLVAEAFIQNTNNKPFVNHKDFNRKNNNVENLEWVTQKENVNWSKQNYGGRKNKTNSNTGEKYISFRKTNNKYRITIDKKEYPSCKTLESAIKARDKILSQL